MRGTSIFLGTCSLWEERGKMVKMLAEMSFYQRHSGIPTGLTAVRR